MLKYLLTLNGDRCKSESFLKRCGLWLRGTGLEVKKKKQPLSGAKPVGLQGWQEKSVSREDGLLPVLASDHPLANTSNQTDRLDCQAQKERYVQYLGVRTDNAVLLQGVVRELIDEGVPRRTLVSWAVEAGCTKGYVASLLSRICVSLGLRERKPGAGRRPSPVALELLAHARSRYGENFLKALRAALRAGRAQPAVANSPNEIPSRSLRLIVEPQLERAPKRPVEPKTVNTLL